MVYRQLCRLYLPIAFGLALLTYFAAPQIAVAASMQLATSMQLAELDAAAVHQLPRRATFELHGVRLADGQPPVALQLEKFAVWKDGATVTVHGVDGIRQRSPQRRSHFRGHVLGDSASFAYASVDAEGTLRGLVVSEERFFVITSHAEAVGKPRRAHQQEVDTAQMRLGRTGNWTCATDALTRLPGPLQTSSPSLLPHLEAIGIGTANTADASQSLGTITLVGDVAIETDWEFFNLFGNADDASGYVSDLVGAVAAIFLRDINARPQISDLYLYTEGADLDPWSAGDVVNAAFEVRDYWNINRPDVERSVVHFLPGRFLGGGVAWVGSLCDTQLGYGVTGEVTGTFDPDNPTIVSDIFVFAHELGHSFGSPHTHCYNGLPMAGDPPIDMCWGSEMGCYSGSTSLPATGGSIMSYCSLGSGGLSNVQLWLGREGFYGERSERVPTEMRRYLESVASCLPENTQDIFRNGFESGDTTGWSQAIGL